MKYNKLILTWLVLLLSSIGLMAKDKDYMADRDFLIVMSFSGQCSGWAKTYFESNVPAEKERAEQGVNSALFQLWLLYEGPWKFDISKDKLASGYLANVRLKFRDIAKKSARFNDPLSILSFFESPEPTGEVARRFPNGTFPNFDAESIKSKQDYANLVESYRKWLDAPKQ